MSSMTEKFQKRVGKQNEKTEEIKENVEESIDGKATSKYEENKEIEYKPSENEREIYKSVEETHPQMSPLVIWELSGMLSLHGELVNLPNIRKGGHGSGYIAVQPKGFGKSCSLETVSNYGNYDDIEVVWADTLTPAGIGRSKGDEEEAESLAESMSESRSFIFVDDLSTLVDREAGENTFKFISQLVYKGEWHDRNLFKAEVKDAEIGVLVAGTPGTIRSAVKQELWQNQTSDRFLRNHWLYFERKELFDESFGEDKPDSPRIPTDLPISHDPVWDVDEVWRKRVRKLFEKQLSMPRANEFCLKWLKGHARLRNSNKVENKDAKCALMYRPVLETENMFTVRPPKRRSDFETRPLKFYAEFSEITAHIAIGYGTVGDIFDKTNIPPATTMNILDHLKKVGLVDFDENYKDIRLDGRFRKDLKKLHSFLGGEPS